MVTMEGTLAAVSGISNVGRHPPITVLLMELFKIAMPMSISQIAQFSFMVVMLICAGHIGVHELGAVSIALGILNATGFAFGSGLCGALETLLSQSYGQNPRSTMYGVYAQRMFFILMVFVVPLSVFLLFVEGMLNALGEPPDVAVRAGHFCHIAIFGLPFFMVLELLRRYYASQHQSNPVFVTLLAAALVNPIVEGVLVYIFGYTGIALGWVFVMLGMDIALVCFLKWSGLHTRTWGGWSSAAFRNWYPMLKLAIPSLGMAFSEWTAMEVNSLCAGLLSTEELGAYAVTSQIANLCWSVVSGLFIAATVLVGNSLGAGNPDLGKQYALLSSVLVLVVSLLNAAVVYKFRDRIPRIFTHEDGISKHFSDMVPYFLTFHVLDAVQSNFLAILRGCGLQLVGVAIVFVCLTIIGTPLGIYLAFARHYGVVGLWVGPVASCAAFGIPAYLYVLFCRIDWASLRPHLEECEMKKFVEVTLVDEDELT
ncbi:membrane transporter protein, putative [Trypanosoma brucei brucei TREU927]|uniref:Membrane transporter protein, putative n=2 Tax=Trypanosoma brucei TaxID=5691 RepID=Q38DL3_TRYB2|nr:uncharacterized protein Tb09.211.2920 [Trypanosoma brucei brucei TREU927]EAN77107.1 membrane transporter protein, putative [Trypanosoma brucei brucei TREU927]